MALVTPQDNTEKELYPIFEDYQGWFIKALRQFFYFEEHEEKSMGLEKKFVEWLAEAQEHYDLPENIIEKLRSLSQELHQIRMRLLASVFSTKTPPVKHDFETFVTLYEELVHNIRRLEKDSISEGNGIDALTGLRSKSVMMQDFAQEMERLSRQGKPFCVAVVRIDDFDRYQDLCSDGVIEKAMLDVADVVKQTLRNFDDAYRMDFREFVFSLKQADIVGGMAAMERLKKGMENKVISIPVDDKEEVITVSSCVVEMVAGDEIPPLLENMRQDLEDPEHDRASILQYQEISALQRFINKQ